MAEEFYDKIVVIRYIDWTTAYHINLRADPTNDMILVRGMPGSLEVLAKSTVTNYKNSWYVLKIVAIGPRIQVYVEGKKYIDFVDFFVANDTERVGNIGVRN